MNVDEGSWVGLKSWSPCPALQAVLAGQDGAAYLPGPGTPESKESPRQYPQPVYDRRGQPQYEHQRQYQPPIPQPSFNVPAHQAGPAGAGYQAGAEDGGELARTRSGGRIAPGSLAARVLNRGGGPSPPLSPGREKPGIGTYRAEQLYGASPPGGSPRARSPGADPRAAYLAPLPGAALNGRQSSFSPHGRWVWSKCIAYSFFKGIHDTPTSSN